MKPASMIRSSRIKPFILVIIDYPILCCFILVLLIITSTPAPDSSTDSAWETSSSGSFCEVINLRFHPVDVSWRLAV